MNDAVLIQQANADGAYLDHLRLAFPGHADYARRHAMDYWCMFSDVRPNMPAKVGGWSKVHLIRDAWRQGYQHIFWVDADALIVDYTVDLRHALQGSLSEVGACQHSGHGLPTHLNVGVLYVRPSQSLPRFPELWLAAFPGTKPWMEQGVFNDLAARLPGVVERLDDRWNSTVGVNVSPRPVVKAWHGYGTPVDRLAAMRRELGG